MITLHVLQWVINMCDTILTHLFNPLYVLFTNLGTAISGLQVPAIIYSTFSLVIYFLPMSTIIVLFNITLGLVAIAIILSLAKIVYDLIELLPLF